MGNKSSLPFLMDTLSECATLLIYELGTSDPELSASGPSQQWRQEEIQKLTASLKRRLAGRTDEWETAFGEMEAFRHPVFPVAPTPLRYLDCFLDILDHSLAGGSDGEAAPGPDGAKAASRRLRRFVEQLLTFSELGCKPLVAGPVRLDRLVATLVESFDREIKGRAVAWSIPRLPVLYADPGMVRTVFQQLISNAIKATHGQERAEIQVGCSPGPKGCLTLRVRDNGRGFDSALAHRVFGVFQHRPRSGPFQGAGLGLASVQRIVERHGGRVWARSMPDQGATFYLAFPDSLILNGQTFENPNLS
jgi:signal transduction histidine kinase